MPLVCAPRAYFYELPYMLYKNHVYGIASATRTNSKAANNFILVQNKVHSVWNIVIMDVILAELKWKLLNTS